MCNAKIIKVHSISCRGVRQVATPCGVCATCRKSQQLEWSFRLKTELLALPKDEWYCVFFTQTYNDNSLPHIPRILLNVEGEKAFKNVALPMCFSKQDVRNFHELLRHWLESKGAKDAYKYKWMTCAEYGEHTKRCHYHTLMCVPSFIDPLELFEKVKELWNEKGFIFPKKFNGGIDKYGYNHKPFVVDSVEKAAGYCSKYISKDLAFEESFDKNLFKKEIIVSDKNRFKKVRVKVGTRWIDRLKEKTENEVKQDEKIRLSDYLCFHLQSRSLGNSFVQKLNEQEKIDFVKNGYFFNGDDFCHHLPKYMLNKFMFENYYLKKDDNRLVRRKPTKFFNEHYNEIFESKVKQMVAKLDEFKTNYRVYLHRFFNQEQVDKFAELESSFYDLSNTELAEQICAYVGCNVQAIEVFKTPVNFWFQRFCYVSKIVNLHENVFEECIDFDPLVNRNYYEKLNEYYFTMQYIIAKIDEVPKKMKLEYQRNIAWVADAFKSYED